MTRARTIERFRRRLVAEKYPRLEMACVVAAAGAAGFVTSWTLLALGMDSMRLRYPLAVVVGYLAFLAVLRLWLAIHRRGGSLDGSDLVDAGDVLLDVGTSLARGGRRAGTAMRGAGGEFGGAGASSSFEVTAEALSTTPVALADLSGPASETVAEGAAEAGGVVVDVASESKVAALILVLAVLALSFVLAAGWVVWTGPALFAELLLDAALVTGLYRRLRNTHRPWYETAVRRTAAPFLVVLVFFFFLAGWAMQSLAPEASSIGDVLRPSTTPQ